MHNITSFSVIAKVGLLAGIILAAFLLSSSLYDSAHARTTTTETVNYPENGQGTVTAYTALDPDGDEVTWSLSGDDDDDFEITGGALTFKNTPNYEDPDDGNTDNTYNRYEVTIHATDGGTEPPPPTQVVIVKVINVDEDGVVSLTTRQPQEAVELTATLADADGPSGSTPPVLSNDLEITGVTWQWARSTNKRTWTEIKDATEAAYTPAADDVDNYLRATASYDDGHGSKKTADQVSDNPVQADTSNKAPVFLDAEGEEITTIAREVAEDAAPGDPVGEPVEATDAHGGLTYTWGGDDASSFTVESGTGQIRVGAGVTLDAETKSSYSISVIATDPANLNEDIMVTITVTNVDEAPTIAAPVTNNGDVTAGHTAKDYPEIIDPAIIAGSTHPEVSIYSATDPEDEEARLKWSLSGADNGKFSITARGPQGTLRFVAAPNFEDPTDAGRNNVYDVTVEVTDSEGNTDKRPVTVKVTNVDEDGTITLSSEQPQQNVGLTASLADPDGASGSTPPLDTNEMRITGVAWQWEFANPSGNSCSTITPGGWVDIPGVGAMSATYTPGPAYVDNCLRATATYTDGHGADKSAVMSSSHTVKAHPEVANQGPIFPDQDHETTGVQDTRAERSVAENAMVGTPLGDPFVAIDNDDDHLTYTLDRGSGSSAAPVKIDRGTGQLSTTATLDHEDRSRYTVRVTATDPSGDSTRRPISVEITVTNVDEPPTITRGETFIEYMENGTGTVSTYAATDPEKASIVWSLGGVDGNLFSITTRGALTFNDPPDYESRAATDPNNEYNVTVMAGDGGDSDVATRDVTVAVINVDEDGEVSLSANQPQEGVELTATLSDDDGTVTGLTWQWARSSSKTGTFTEIKDAATTCDPQAPQCYKPDKDDVGKYLRATASYDDGHGGNKTADGVSDRPVQADTSNKAPVFQNADGEDIATIDREVAEDADPGDPVGEPVEATDAHGGLTYKLDDGADASSFTIHSGTGQIEVGADVALDAETKTSYTVTVTATDPEPLNDSITVTITVTNVDEAPTEIAGLAAISHQEEMPNTPTLSTYNATDPEGDTVVWSLSGHDANHFCIDESGVLTFKASPDYEDPKDAGRNNRYEVTVVASDSAGTASSRDVTVTVTNADDEGTVTLSSEQPQDAIDLTATLTDPDGAAGSTPPLNANEMRITGVTWEWASTAPGGNDCPDATGWVRITRANAQSATFRPVLPDVGRCLQAMATYTDGHGADKTAVMRSAHPVQPRDPGNLPPVFPDQDLNKEKVQNDRAERSVREDAVSNMAIDTNVGDPVSANDPDDANLTYRLSGVDARSFKIGRGDGQITVPETTKLDHETKNTYTVTVTVTDPSGESASIIVTIKVTDVDERPELSKKALVVSGRSNIDHPENDTTTVATYTAAGPQAGRASWNLLGDDAGDFTISGGTLRFRSTPNYESPADRGTDNVYNITVRARSGAYTATQNVTVTVANLDEDGAVSLSPSRAALGVELTASLTDPDGRSGAVPPITSAETNLTDDAAWQWARSPDGDSGWTNIVGATSNTYTPVQANQGAYLRATASYTDAQGFGKRAIDVTTQIAAVRPDGRVTLSSSRPEVGLDLTASLTDPDGGVTGLTWQWERSPDRTTWNNIVGATSATYTPDAGDLGEYLRATASYTDREASGQTAEAVSGVVIAGQPDGTVTLSSTQPSVGTTVTATLNDPDGSVSGLAWQWARSPNGTTGWTNISGATSDAYLPVAADDGMYLRATARYTDAQASGQTAERVSGVVRTATTETDLLNRYDANGNGQIERDEAVAAVNDYFDDRITRDEVIRVIQAYLTS